MPNEWREGCITALFKKGSRKMASNYRPVSLTCILCKVLEKFIRDHIVNHMKRNTSFSPKQFGFISGRSISLQLLYVLERWTKILDEGGSLDCIYFDFMIKPVFSDHLPYVTLFQCSLRRSHKTGLTGST